MNGQFSIEPLQGHDQSRFSCGAEALDVYIRKQAGQDVRRGVTTCYLAVQTATGEVAGYYTIAMSAVPLSDLPEETRRKLPRYPLVPAARLGRLAVDHRYRGAKLGATLLWDALERTRGSGVAAYALVVDAKDDTAASFYRHHGFIELTGRTLFAPLTR